MISKDELLTKVTEKDIMEFYWGHALEEKKAKYKNPTRTDNKGTCVFKWTGNKYHFIDYAQPSGLGIHRSKFSCFDYVMWHYSCSFTECLHRIESDMNLALKPTSLVIRTAAPKKTMSTYVAIKIETRKYVDLDYAYWLKFGIKGKTLRDFKVYALQKMYTNSKCSTKWELVYNKKQHNQDNDANNYAYAYVFGDRVKVYQPYSEFAKWRGNVSSNDIYGLDLLPKRGKVLYIASGCKDAMCMYQMGLDVIAPQSESAGISPDIMCKLKNAFDKVIVVFDNDVAGEKNAILFAERHNVSYITLPDEFGKDVAEIRSKTNEEYTLDLITDLTNGSSEERRSTRGTTSDDTRTNETVYARNADSNGSV